MADDGEVRYEVLVNGVRRCIAGSSGPGTLDASVIRWRSARFDDSDDASYLHVGGLRSVEDLHVRWVTEELAEGDEVTIRILGPGEFDEPSHTSRREEDEETI
jgi:hypothetical protein